MPRTTIKTAPDKSIYNAEDRALARDRIIFAQINALVAEVAELKTAIAAHTHGGVTAGAASTAVPATITYANPEANYVE